MRSSTLGLQLCWRARVSYGPPFTCCGCYSAVSLGQYSGLKDLNAREIGLLLPLLILMLFMGIFPRVFLDRSAASVDQVRIRVAGPPTGGSFASVAPVEGSG